MITLSSRVVLDYVLGLLVALGGLISLLFVETSARIPKAKKVTIEVLIVVVGFGLIMGAGLDGRFSTARANHAKALNAQCVLQATAQLAHDGLALPFTVTCTHSGAKAVVTQAQASGCVFTSGLIKSEGRYYTVWLTPSTQVGATPTTQPCTPHRQTP